MEGELGNTKPGKVTGWMRFFRNRMPPLRVTFDLEGDFHEDIRGALIRLSNPQPSDRNIDGKGSYMEGLSSLQRGTVGDITAGLPLGPWTDKVAEELMAQCELIWDELGVKGPEREKLRQEYANRHRKHISEGDLYFCYVSYPYVEWYADNGRVVLELDPSQIEIVKRTPTKPKTPAEFVDDEKRRVKSLYAFMTKMMESSSRENRDKGGDGNVTGLVAG